MREFYIDMHSGTPAYRQIVDEIKIEIAEDILKEGDKIPTVRDLALKIHVNPNTVARAYRELEREGVVETFVGRGTFVKKDENSKVQDKIDILIDDLLYESENKGIDMDILIKKLRERGGKK